MHRPTALSLAAAGIVLLCFWPVCSHCFLIYDDDIHVSRNPHFRPNVGPNVGRFWRKPYEGLYVPVAYTVWGAAVALTSEPGPDGAEHDPRVFHALNLLAHLLSTLVVLALMRSLLSDDWAALAAALLFALHPLQVEPVAWVSGFKGLLAGLLALVAVRQYLIFARTEGKGPWLHYALAAAAFVLAILSSPGAVVAPLLAGVLALTLLRRPVRRTVLELLPWLVLAAPIAVITKLSQPDVKIDFTAPLWQRPLIAGDAIAFYLSKLSLPLWLGPDYGRTPQLVLEQPAIWITALTPAALAALLVWKCRRRWALAAAGVFLAALLPVLGLVPFAFQNVSTVADRYVYVAMLGPALALGWFVKQHRGRRALVVCVLLLGTLGVLSAVQVHRWSDTVTLFEHALTVNPRSAVSHVNLGVKAQRDGDFAAAIDHYEQALTIDPAQLEAHYNLGTMEHKAGRLGRALFHFSAAVAAHPSHSGSRYALAFVLEKLGQLDEAAEHYTTLLDLTGHRRDLVYYRLGEVRRRQHRLADAAQLYEKALAANPLNAKARSALARLERQKTEAPSPAPAP